MPGQFRVTAKLQIAQFWPEGKSDADTATVQIDPSGAGLEFREHSSLPWRPQPALMKSKVKGRQGTDSVVRSQNKLSIRLQGIDAPELHFRPTLPGRRDAPEITDAQRTEFKNWNEDYRQPLGESATQALHAELSTLGTPDIEVHVFSYVDEPNDLFDVYGRLVGNVVVASTGLDLNVWLLENGWVFPAYYNSMSPDEINTLNSAWDRGWQIPGRLWDQFDYQIPNFDPSRIFRSAPGASDGGIATVPKIFRRQALWFAMKKSRILSGSLVSYLRANPESVQLTPDFLSLGGTAAPWYKLSDFILSNGELNFDPEMLIFQESSSTLLDDNGNRITAWE